MPYSGRQFAGDVYKGMPAVKAASPAKVFAVHVSEAKGARAVYVAHTRYVQARQMFDLMLHREPTPDEDDQMWNESLVAARTLSGCK